MKSIAALFGVDRPFDPTGQYVTSWLLKPMHLAILRLVLGTYALITMSVALGLEAYPLSAQSFSYFTDLTYWGLAFYMLSSGYHTLRFAMSGATQYPLQRWGRVAQGMHACYYAANTVFPPIVTITFWAILYKAPFFPAREQQWSNISMHGLNSAYMLLEVILPCTPVLPLLSLPVLIVILALYLGLAYLTHDTQGFYAYSFLNPQEGASKRALYIVGILLATVVVWLLVRAAIWARIRLTKGFQKGVEQRDKEGIESYVEMA